MQYHSQENLGNEILPDRDKDAIGKKQYKSDPSLKKKRMNTRNPVKYSTNLTGQEARRSIKRKNPFFLLFLQVSQSQSLTVSKSHSLKVSQS